MSRKKLIQKKPKCDPVLWGLLTDQPVGIAKFIYPEKELEKLWNDYRGEILEDWIKLSPGTRPTFWWQFEASEPRKITGKFVLLREIYPALLSYAVKGIPQNMETTGEVFIESEASYLLRHNLFLKGEKKWIRLYSK